MALYPGAPMIDPNVQFFDANGDPLALGSLTFYQAGTTTLLDTFNDSDLAAGHENSNPLTLNAAGRSATSIFFQPEGYKIVLKDSTGATVWTRDEQESWNVFPSTWGTKLGTGVTYTTGSTILVTTNLAIIDSAAGATTIYLPSAASATQPLTIKNSGGNTVAVTPDGSDTLDFVAGAFSMAAAVSPTFPSILIASDGISAWTILGSHGL